MKTKYNTTKTDTSIVNFPDFVIDFSSKRSLVKKRLFIRNLLKTNKNLLDSNNINSLILF